MSSSKIRLKEFPSTFWVANTLEIFERMAWYGFFAVSSLYITGATREGGLGFTDEDRGVIQGVGTFFLYLFPVVTGALADRYGFKKMLITAFIVLIPAYYLLGQLKTFPTFFLAFMLVALGAAMFKPVIIGTVLAITRLWDAVTDPLMGSISDTHAHGSGVDVHLLELGQYCLVSFLSLSGSFPQVLAIRYFLPIF